MSKGTVTPVWELLRHRTLFSGLMECGGCGSGFSKTSKYSFGCSAAHNKAMAVCTNMRLIKQKNLETAVLKAMQHHLMDPEAVAIFCEAYRAERNRLVNAATTNRKSLEKELASAIRDHAKLVDAIIAGIAVAQVKDRMNDLDARRKTLEAQLGFLTEAPEPLRFHPKMAVVYREKVSALIAALGEAAPVATDAKRHRSSCADTTPDSAPASAGRHRWERAIPLAVPWWRRKSW
ncbi:MAG: zinc ribbon domain-containing protein, partial [Cypionkella sp.]|uniref:zinc ribbon domain-containing protein n=1 Tax=Cypionkella sp. TaxID=2811411 RepID=UPI002AB9FFC7